MFIFAAYQNYFARALYNDIPSPDYLHRQEGAQDVINFKFAGELECDMPAPEILATKLGTFTYNDFDGPTQHIPAKDEVERIVQAIEGERQ